MSELWTTCPGECGSIVKVHPLAEKRYVNYCCLPCWEWYRDAGVEGVGLDFYHSDQCQVRQVERFENELVERPPNIMGPVEWKTVKDAEALGTEGTA